MSRIKALIAAAALSLTSVAFAATVKVSDISYIDFTGDGENFSSNQGKIVGVEGAEFGFERQRLESAIDPKRNVPNHRRAGASRVRIGLGG